MQEKTAGGTPAAPMKLDVSVRVIEPVKNLMGFASVKVNDCFVVENLKIVQGSKGLFLGMPSQPDGKGGYRDMAYPVTKEFREQLNTAVLQAYEAKLEQMAERGSVGRASIRIYGAAVFYLIQNRQSCKIHLRLPLRDFGPC